jgi:hypothetical protein
MGYMAILLLMFFSWTANADALRTGGMELNYWHIEKWYVSCHTDKVENKSSCGAELNAFDLPEPKSKDLSDIDVNFYMTANRVDVHETIIRGSCPPYISIDAPHLKTNLATEIRWRSEKMNKPSSITSFRDVSGARLFLSGSDSSLQKAIEAEKTLYLKTISANGTHTFAISTKGYQKVCKFILTKEHSLNSDR